MMVEQTVNESGCDARGSCLSSAYVWTSSKVFLRIFSSAGKFDSQKVRLITSLVFSFDERALADNNIIQKIP